MQERARGFSIATQCASEDDFIAKYSTWANEGTIFVATKSPRAESTECGFAILLADKKPVLAGICVVLETFLDANNPFKRPGMRLKIKRMGAESQRVFAQLESARTAVPVISARPTTRSLPVVRAVTPRRVPTVSIPPLEAPRERPRATSPAPLHVRAEGSKETPAARVEQRVPGSSYVLPANPLMDITDASLEGFVDDLLTPVPRTAAMFAIPEPIETPVAVEPPVVVEPPAAVAVEPQSVPIVPIIERPRVATHPVMTAKRWPYWLAAIAAVAIAAGVFVLLRAEASASIPALSPTNEAIEPAARATATDDAAPAPRAKPTTTKRQPIHAVLVRTAPSHARVTIDGRSFGNTPTYIKVPANTPVEVTVTRPGYKPITHVVTSKSKFDRVWLRLRPAR